MPKRKNMMCYLRRDWHFRNGFVARNSGTDKIYLTWSDSNGHPYYIDGLNTKDARLLAKRINQFLDAGG